jgi:hypothetical protein
MTFLSEFLPVLITVPIVVTTTQGQLVYKVTSVRQQRIGVAAADAVVGADTAASTAAGVTTTTAAATATTAADATTTSAPDAGDGASPTTTDAADGPVTVDELYGTATDDRLTLVTSASADPRNDSQATVVVAVLQGLPFAPTPQNGRTDSQSGLSGDPVAWPALVLALAGFTAAAAAAVVLYRRSTIRIAYLLTTPALIAFVILAAESASRLLPSWM